MKKGWKHGRILFMTVLFLLLMTAGVQAASLSARSITIPAGTTYTLKVKGAGKSKITWKSSKKSVASVNSKGVVKGVKAGSAKITAKVGKQTLTCNVSVKTPSINAKQVTIEANNTYQLKMNNAGSAKITWASSNKSVVIVSSKGLIKGKKKGTAKITAKLGGKTYTCNVTVRQTPVLNVKALTLTAGGTYQLRLNNASGSVAWSSSSAAVASVSKTGLVKAVKAGSARITARNNKKNYVCTVTVKAPVTQKKTVTTTTTTTVKVPTKTTVTKPAPEPKVTDKTTAGSDTVTTVTAPKTSEEIVLNEILRYRNGTTWASAYSWTDLMRAEKNPAADVLAQKWSEGSPYTNANYYGWEGGIYRGGYGCAGFAFFMSDRAFERLNIQNAGGAIEVGVAKTLLPLATRYDMREYVTASGGRGSRTFRVGDILRTDYNTHSVIILKVDYANGYVIVGEGNYNKSCHWGRKVTLAELGSSGTNVLTRYGDSTKAQILAVRRIRASLPVLRDDK